MRGDSQGLGNRLFGRRTFLGAVGAGAVSLGMTGTAAADWHYDRVVNVVEHGADDTGEESINPVLEDLAGDSVRYTFPSGTYKMDRQFRHTDFDAFGMVGDDATIVPVPADEWQGDAKRLFKLGTYVSPGNHVHVENLTFDYSAPNTGLRALQIEADDPYVRRVTVRGKHDTGNWGPGPMLVNVTDPNGKGHLRHVHLTGGGEIAPRSDSGSLGPIGFVANENHVGKLDVFACKVFNFPSDGFYSSTEAGTVVIRKGRYKNSNVAAIRLSGQHSKVLGANVVVRRNPDGWADQRGIRLDGGDGFVIKGVEMWHPKPNGAAIRLTNDAGDTRIEDANITMGNGKSDAISISEDTGRVEIADSSITKNGRGQAIKIGPGGHPVTVENVTIDGDAPGGDGGSHAIRCERDDSEFRWMHVHQPGPDYRRCISINADGCVLVGGRYRSTHHAIVLDGDDLHVRDVIARAYDGVEGVKVLEGHSNVNVVNSTVWNGIENQGSDVDTSGNSYPSS